jgi:hypothetical protein
MALSREDFDVLFEKSGLPLSKAQKDTLFGAYPMLLAMIARATNPLPREAEPALTFRPEAE